MEIQTRDENTLRKYLLGDMLPDQQEEIELWLISDEEAYESPVAAEDDLIDDSLAGNLKSNEVEQFNNHFLTAPERRRKLQFGRSFQRFVSFAQPGQCF